MASIFTITEDDLFNFESFCDQKYSDPNCQKYGFFKVKLAEDCAGKWSSFADMTSKFSTECLSKIREIVLLRNPKSSSLYGHHNIAPNSSERSHFLHELKEGFPDNGVSPNCCMEALQVSEDTFLQHFYSELTAHTKVIVRDKKYDLPSIRKRAEEKANDYKKRQLYEKAPTFAAKKRCLEGAMAAEVLLKSSSRKCRCEICNVRYEHVSTSCQNKKDNVPILYCAGVEENQNKFLYLTENFAMAQLCFKNMLGDLDSVFGGVSYPSLYVGGQHSAFALHTEDLSCWSFNFLMDGCPKFWIMIPPTSVSRLTDALHQKGFHGTHKWCRNTLNHKFYIPHPQFLKEENIPYEVVFQHKGEGIVVLPNTAHTGGNLGNNLAQACNYGSRKWIPYGCVSPNCMCESGAVHADLSELVAVHEPTLLKAYLDNNIPNVIEDEYFKKSIVVRSGDMTSRCGAVSPLPVCNEEHTLERIKNKKSTKVQCPACAVSWAYVQKRNIVAHILRHHSSRQEDEIFKTFIQKYSLPINE